MKHIHLIKDTINHQDPRFAMAIDPQADPVAQEASLAKVIATLKERMKAGKTFVAPQRVMAGDKFSGMQLIVIDPIIPGSDPTKQMKINLAIQIFTKTKTIEAQTEQNFIAYAIQAIAVAEFIAEAEKEAAESREVDKAISGAKGNLEQFPSPTPQA